MDKNKKQKTKSRCTDQKEMSAYTTADKINHLLKKHPDRIPLVITKAANQKDGFVDSVPAHKLLVPNEYTVANVMYVLRKRLSKLLPQQGIFLFLESSVMPATSTPIQQVYDQHKDKDGTLRMVYALENTFGGTASPLDPSPLSQEY